MSDKTWKTLRVVVELPIRGSYTAKQMSRDVEAALDKQLSKEMLSKPRGLDIIEVGNLRVKEYNRVKARQMS